MITQERLHELFDYNKNTGLFVNKTKRNRLSVVGSVAGTSDEQGYTCLIIDGERQKAHRMAWLYVYGVMPKNIDHINKVRSDNRIANLRDVSHAENCKNKRKNKNNSTGVTGVIWHKRQCKYHAVIRVNYKRIHLGSFSSVEEAAEARRNAMNKYGFSSTHGIN